VTELRTAQAALTGDVPVWFEGGHHLALLTGGDQLFPELVRTIDAAREHVGLATYIFYGDACGRTVADALIRAAARGVTVRVLVDGFGSGKQLPVLRRWFDGSGVAFAVFRPVDRWYAPLQPSQFRRLHPKLVAVDGEVGFVGGINIVDDRFDVNHGPTDAPRLDFAMQVRGPVVGAIAFALDALWRRATQGVPWREELRALVGGSEWMQRLRAFASRRPPPAFRDTRSMLRPDLAPERVALVVRDNLRQRRTIERAYIRAIDQASQRIDLISPYFYPARAFMRALLHAARRGVKVRVLLQGKIDYRLAGLASSALYDQMLRHGIRVFEYTPAYLHAKVAVIDDNWATVGSSNIDPLSLLLNIEANALVDDVVFARALGAEFERAIAQSREVTLPSLASGWTAMPQRALVAWIATWYLRLTGISGRY
jgi:cardiolipin synthase A/B